ncbi:MAG: hypothetical protein H7Y17_03420 [Chlorobia bacterium]|nr:hypothetical protein [Fimbriimonadaceae bacterium]
MIVALLSAVVMSGNYVPQVPKVKMLAASAMVGQKPEVRLRWVVFSGWIPDGGYRLYRLNGTQKQLIFPAPTRKNVAGLKHLNTGGPKQVIKGTTPAKPDISTTFTLANKPLGASAVLMTAGGARAKSSADLFRTRMESSVNLRKNPIVGQGSLPEALNRLAPIQQFFGSLKPRPSTAPVVTSEEAKVVNARRSIIIASLTSEDVADAVGLGAKDMGVQSGQVVSYALFEVGAGGKDGTAPVATINNFEVGKDPLPPTPANVLAAQTDHGIFELRWDRVAEAVEDDLGLVTYHVRRSDAPGAAGKPLTNEPIVIPDIPTKTGIVEPIAFYTDRKAPVGRISYQVILEDCFGRRSAPGTIEVASEDLRTPNAPNVVRARLREHVRKAMPKGIPGPVQVYWQAQRPADVRFNIYREDSEQPGNIVKLTPTPIPGERVTVGSPTELLDLYELVMGESLTEIEDDRKRALETAKFGAKLPTITVLSDSTAEPDRKYRYYVNSVLLVNNRESNAVRSGVVDVPKLTKPGPPTGVQFAAFKPSSSRPIAHRSFTKSERNVVREKQDRFEKQFRKTIIAPGTLKGGQKAPIKLEAISIIPEDQGGTVQIAWTMPSGHRNPLIRVYREVENMLGSKIEAGQARTASFTDSIPRSYKTTYLYSFVTESRWGIRGTASPVAKFVATACLAPSVPNLINVGPDIAGGGLQIQWRPNPAEQQVKTFRVFRKGVKPVDVKNASPSFRNTAISRLRGRVSGQKGTTGGGQRPVPPAADPENDQGYTEVATLAAGSAQMPVANGVATFKDTPPDPKLQYYYKLVAVNEIGLFSDRSEPLGSGLLRMSIPAPTSVTTSLNSGNVNVSWTAVPGATGYIVKRGPETGATIQVSGVITGVSFVDKTAMRGKRYRYEVLALDGFGNISQPTASAAVTVMP